MSELKTNKISTNDTNNVAIDTALGLKTYTTSQKNALTSVAGDLVYDTDLNKAQIHNGTSWGDIGETDRALDIDFLVVAGGGSGIVIIKYPDTYTLTIGSGLVESTATVTGYKVTTFESGTDSISLA